MAAGDEQTTGQQQGFWKLHHAAIGLGVLVLMIFAVRSCGGDADDETMAESESGEKIPRHAIVVQIPASQLPTQVAPGGQQQSYQPPVYVQQPQPGLPATDPGNPWAVQRQPAYNYGNQNAPRQSQAPGWGQHKPRPPLYSQPPGSGQYRPLEEKPRTARENRSVPVVPAPVRPVAPYDRLSGSSFGANGAYPYAGTQPGYYGTAPYMGPPGAYGGRWPGAYSPGYPGIVGPGAWAW